MAINDNDEYRFELLNVADEWSEKHWIKSRTPCRYLHEFSQIREYQYRKKTRR